MSAAVTRQHIRRAHGMITAMQRTDSDVEHLVAPARHLAQGDDNIWHDHHFVWKRPDTWTPQLTAWLSPRFRRDGMRRLKPGRFRDLCWDDSEWSDVLERCLVADFGYHANALANALDPAVMRTFHGCRTADAGSYFRGGLRVHDRAAMTAQVKTIVTGSEELRWMRDRVDAAIAEIENELDPGRLYVVADDTVLLKRAAHYLIYGSEWVSAVLGAAGRRVLLQRGAPTLLEIDLPLRMSSVQTRTELATKMLREWTRLACNRPDWSAPIDFSFCLRTDIPAAWIVCHSHPAELHDPLEQERIYRSRVLTCAHCASQS